MEFFNMTWSPEHYRSSYGATWRNKLNHPTPMFSENHYQLGTLVATCPKSGAFYLLKRFFTAEALFNSAPCVVSFDVTAMFRSEYLLIAPSITI
jgi:hypothetical protein